jgi:hypothetical protein
MSFYFPGKKHTEIDEERNEEKYNNWLLLYAEVSLKILIQQNRVWYCKDYFYLNKCPVIVNSNCKIHKSYGL